MGANPPSIVGTLWYSLKTGTLWQVRRGYGGQSKNTAHAIAEISGVMLDHDEGQIVHVRKRLSLLELTTEYHFFGTVHDTVWEGDDDAQTSM